MTTVKAEEYTLLKKSIELLMSSGHKGTIEYFSDVTGYHQDEVAACISVLEKEGKAQVQTDDLCFEYTKYEGINVNTRK